MPYIKEGYRKLIEPMLIYLASPYTQGDIGANINRVIDVADILLENGHYPYIPHLNHLWHIVSSKTWEIWLDYDLFILSRCDALLRLDGDSKGADIEVKEAERLGKKVYTRIEDLIRDRNE